MHTILFPVNVLHTAGAELQLLKLVHGLDKRRYRPIVAPLYAGGSLEADFRAIPGAKLVPLHRRGKYDPMPLWRIARLLRRERVDIVQPFLTPATFFGIAPALALRTPVTIVTERCGVRQERGVGYKTYRMVEDWMTRFADAVVPNSAAGREILLERGIPDEKIEVIYNGINLQRLAPDLEAVTAHRARLGVPPGGKVVGILASLTPPKDHATFLRAAALVSADRPDIRYAIVGGGDLQPELERLAADLGIADRVTFFGYQKQVGDVLAAFDLLVSSSCDNEGCSNSILEAMAIHRPVVATDVGGNRELVEDGVTGFLTPARDHAAIAAAISRALSNPELARAVTTRARHQIDSHFSLTGMVAQYEGLYARLLAEKLRVTRPLPRDLGTERPMK